MKCFNIMKIMQLQLYLLIRCQAAETLTDQVTDLGQHVTINCDLDVTEVIWLLLKLDSPVLILRTFSSTAPFYFKKTFKQKYSVQTKHNLFINNVTIDDLGVYYCVKIDPPQEFNNGIRLYVIAVNVLNITEPTAEIQNHTVQEQNQTRWHIIILISALLNGLLNIVITGLLRSFIYGNKRTRDGVKQFQELEVMDLEQPQDSTQVQYVAVDFPQHVKVFSPATMHFYSCRNQELKSTDYM